MAPTSSARPTGAAPISRRSFAVLTVTAALGAAGGCGLGSDPLAARSKAGPSDAIVVGSANFQDNQILAHIYSQALQDRGLAVEERFNIASREAYLPGLKDGSIDVIPEYSGALLQFLHPKTSATRPAEVTEELAAAVPRGLTALQPSDAENKDVLAVTRATARRYDLSTISDLRPHAGALTLGAPPEWKTRHNGVPGLEDVYDLRFKEFTALDAGGPLTLNALVNGQVDVGDLFSADPAIDDEDLVALKDDRDLFLAENILPLARTSAMTPAARETLDAISGHLTTAQLSRMLRRVVTNKENPTTVARDWLAHADVPG